MVRLRLRSLSLVAVLFCMGLLVLLVSGQAGPAAAQGVTPEPYPFSDRYPAEVRLELPEDLALLRAEGIDVGDVRPAGGTGRAWAPTQPFEPLIATVYVNPGEAARLAEHGLAADPIPNESLRAQRLYGPGSGAPNAWPTYDQYVGRMQALAAAHPNIVRLISIGHSFQGRDLWVLKISDNPDVEEDEPEFKYSANHHGDETVGVEITVRLAELLANSYGTDVELTRLVDEMEIWLWPIYNPDGYVAGSRYNARGIDLNRDFPDRLIDPVDDPTGREPETQAAMYWGYAHRFVMGANYHGGALVVNIPWDAVPDPNNPEYAPDDAILYNYGTGYAQRNPMLWGAGWPGPIIRGWDWYMIDGGMQDWAYYWQGEQHVTIEIGTKKPAYDQVGTYWDANREAMLWWMERVLRGARGLITDANTGAPLEATVDVVGIGKAVRTDPEVGDYHRLLLPGDYTLVASAYCYLPQPASVTVVDGPATVQDFALEPGGPWTVEGAVTAQDTGQPLSATIKFEGTGIVGHTDPETGLYATSVCTGTFTMTVSAPGYCSGRRQVTVEGDQTQNFELDPTCAVVYLPLIGR